ncbi:MAG TPA: hypothetical protein VN442_03005 [Bryobacteraceae bacterium]|nr:hypothetical protein [Bryobacteraceae bacterium]
MSFSTASAAVAGAASAARRPGTGFRWRPGFINRSFVETRRWSSVNQFFENPMQGYLNQLKRAGRDCNVEFIRIIVDDEGDMAAPENRSEWRRGGASSAATCAGARGSGREMPAW